ncbi:expressed protein [Phakopsora pachyrhizi]|uniref:Expressed protein n=1 Tax=Phakopsora pachyrhizi TaxID=170000 RepID=A0AAV0BGP2_PHAPC|nr:expressed protein [Phakopsora pachyrhizi]
MTDQNQKLLNRFWNRWNELIIEKKLLLKEEMIVLNLDYRLRSDFFKIWVSRLLPSFNFDRDRLKKRFFRDWVLILRLKEIRDLAILRDRKQVLKEAFRVWWSKCTAIKASRIFR